jgi:ribosome-associated protein
VGAEGTDVTPVPAEVLAAARSADGKGATDVVILEVGPVSAVSSFFVICSAATDRQVRAIADAVEETVAEVDARRPLGVEGRDTLEWVLLNYGDFLVHVFRQETREFYDLERLWADAAKRPWALQGRSGEAAGNDEGQATGP